MMRLAKEGYPFIAFFAVITITVFVIGNVWIAFFPIILTIFMFYFFRDPEREIPEGEGIFVSPADGKIILIKNVLEAMDADFPSLLTNPPHPNPLPQGERENIGERLTQGERENIGERLTQWERGLNNPPPLTGGGEGEIKLSSGQNEYIQVSIFISPFNVHVNRAPCDGKIKSVQHNKGKFMAAYKGDASFRNENIEMTLDTKYGDILVRQVAGYVARRAVCRANAGDSLRRGERYGIIKFSSRLDVYLPKDTQTKVKLGDKVKAGETIIGSLGR
ncbi:MAG: phosphatidylserine decarboxylase [Nitrospirae bacterium]|nr:phosphatidylserine decarboxylase [Nitrospirota bacterium]